MGLKASDILGTSQVGVHLAMVGRVLFAPLQLSKKDVRGLEDCLGLEVAQMSVGGSTLVGALIAGNSNGIAVADIATEEDIDRLTSFGDVVVMESGVNAAGNLLIVNENGAVASPILPVPTRPTVLPNTLNPIITAPVISDNAESTEITITLEAQDPFQVLDEESSISDPIVITIVNDNTPPEVPINLTLSNL